LIDTLAQRRIGLPAATLRCIAHLLKNHHWLFVGWSGLDLAAEPNYLGLRAHAQDALGFTWLVRQGTAARREVATLVGAYGDTRARIVHGELPGWLEALARMAGTTGAPSAADGVIAQPGVGMRQAVQNWAAEGDPVRFCLAAADLLKAAGQPDAALELLEAVRTRAQIERPADEPYALLLCALGILRRERGMLDTAEMLFREALPLFRQNQHYFATTLSNLGLVEEARGNWAEAGRIAGEVSVLFEQLDNVRSQAAAQHNAARALFELGHYDEARILYQSELVLVARCGDEPGRAGALQSLGELLIRMGHFDDAGARLNEAEALHARLGDERGRAQTLASLGELDRLRGAWESAQARLLQALTVFERLGSLDDQATTISGLARLAFNDGDFTEALRLFTRELELRERVGGELPAALTRMNVGCVLLARGDLDEARPLLEGACTAFQRLGASNELQLARRNLATLERRTLDWQAP
jgi:tetratricopeptide (TPR) repeat protein